MMMDTHDTVNESNIQLSCSLAINKYCRSIHCMPFFSEVVDTMSVASILDIVLKQSSLFFFFLFLPGLSSDLRFFLKKLLFPCLTGHGKQFNFRVNSDGEVTTAIGKQPLVAEHAATVKRYQFSKQCCQFALVSVCSLHCCPTKNLKANIQPLRYIPALF